MSRELQTGTGARCVAVYLKKSEQRQLQIIVDALKGPRPSQAAAIRWAISELAGRIPYREHHGL